MSFEHPAFSFDQRQPPTPTRTPTSPSFTDVFRTPRFDSTLFDSRGNWDSTLLKTPKPLSFGSTHGSQPNDIDFLANAQHLLATPDFSSLPIGSSFGSERKDGSSQAIAQPTLSLDTSFEPKSSIQTPPPTTTSASKRQGKKANVQDGKDMSPSRRKSVPILPKPAGSGNAGATTEASPGELEFSPQFGWAPATAPAYPQQKLFWEPEASDTNTDITTMSFNNSRAGLEAFVSTHPSISTSQRTITDDFNFGEDTTPMASFNQDASGFDIQGLELQGVDPSLLFSSPGRGGVNTTTNVSLPEDSMQPYAYQLQEARREKAYSRIGKAQRRRKPSVDSPAVRAALEQLREDNPRPVLHRSMTDTALSRMGHDTSMRAVSAHGRSSPLKAVREARKKQIHSHRTSIALTIDEHGRARAEARQDDAMDIDSDTESSCTASSVDDIADDLVTSFAKGPKMGHFGRASNHSQQSSTTSFYSVSSHGERSVTAPEVIPEDESEAETVLNSEDEGHAQDQLRKAVQNRHSRIASHHHYSPQSRSMAVFPQFGNSSPTTIPDPELPSPYKAHSPSHSEIRCVCNTAIDDGQMIQCESCKKWLHIPCAGLSANHLPNIYLCIFCTGATPAVRNGRIRDPLRKGYRSATGPSPLAKKNSRHR